MATRTPRKPADAPDLADLTRPGHDDEPADAIGDAKLDHYARLAKLLADNGREHHLEELRAKARGTDQDEVARLLSSLAAGGGIFRCTVSGSQITADIAVEGSAIGEVAYSIVFRFNGIADDDPGACNLITLRVAE